MRHKLFVQDAEEYDAALNAAPDSLYFLELAIQANRLGARVARAKDLQTRLAKQPRGAIQ
jgi:hypothetical protein